MTRPLSFEINVKAYDKRQLKSLLVWLYNRRYAEFSWQPGEDDYGEYIELSIDLVWAENLKDLVKILAEEERLKWGD